MLPLTLADCRLSAGIYHHASSCGNQHFASSLKEGAYGCRKSLHNREAGLCYASKDSLQGGVGPDGDRALACSLFTGLVLGKDEQGSLLSTMGQPFPVQVVLEQKKGAPYKCPMAGFHLPTDGHLRHGAAAQLERRAAQEDWGLFGGVGVGVELAAQSPYMSLNLHQVLSKRGSLKVHPLTGLSQVREASDGQDGGSACYASGSLYSKPPCESHTDIPSYIGTSVIITNKR